MAHQLTDVKVSRDESAWEADIRATIPADVMQQHRAAALKEIQKTAKLDGFRPGKAPEERIVQVYGEGAILREAAQHAVEHELPELLAGENLLIIEAPRVTTATPESGKPLAITARASLAPEVRLPDYKSIAAKHPLEEGLTISDQEHAEALMHIRRERARIDKIEAGVEPQKAAEEARAMEAKDLPELDEAFVQSIGYENAEAFSSTLRGNMLNEKLARAREKRRSEILDDLVAQSTVKYPAMMREYELNDMESRMQGDLERVGTSFDAYLVQIKKTKEELRETWKDAADKRAKVRLILSEIARQEKLEPAQDVLNHEMEHAKQHYPSADEGSLRMHIAHALRNEMTLRFLEGDTEQVGHAAHEH